MQRDEERLLEAGDEDRFLIRFRISRGRKGGESEEDKRLAEDHLLEELSQRDAELRQTLKEEVT
jgi:hypothetical protein